MSSAVAMELGIMRENGAAGSGSEEDCVELTVDQSNSALLNRMVFSPLVLM